MATFEKVEQWELTAWVLAAARAQAVARVLAVARALAVVQWQGCWHR